MTTLFWMFRIVCCLPLFYLMDRSSPEWCSYMHRAGALFQEWIVVQWAKIEQQKLSWIGTHQDTLRAEVYSTLRDRVQNPQPLDPRAMGRRVILPSSFVGGPRYMNQLYHDGMAIVRKVGPRLPSISCKDCGRGFSAKRFWFVPPPLRPSLPSLPSLPLHSYVTFSKKRQLFVPPLHSSLPFPSVPWDVFVTSTTNANCSFPSCALRFPLFPVFRRTSLSPLLQMRIVLPSWPALPSLRPSKAACC